MKINSYLNKSCYEIIKYCSNEFKNKIAFYNGNTKIKYSSFLNKIDECALAFKKIGVCESDVVTIISPNNLEMIICFYAINKLGAIANMIHPFTKEKEIKDILNKTNSKYLVISDTEIDKIDDKYDLNKIICLSVIDTLNYLDRFKYIFKNKKILSNIEVLPYYRFILKGKYSKDIVKSKTNKKDIALIINNNSKSIMLSNKNLNSYVLNQYKNYDYSDSIILSNYYLTNNYGISLVHKSLINGSSFIILKDVTDIKSIIKYKPNIIECNPNFLNILSMNRKILSKDLSFIKLIISNSESINEVLREKLNKYLTNTNIFNIYGMIECTSNITWNNNTDKIDSIGTPVNNTEIKIFKLNSFDECKIGEVGEICVSSSTIMVGYLENESNKLQKYKGKLWFRTGDLGYLDKDNYLYFKSSIKRVIISDGNKIYPEELEKIILNHPYIAACFIVGVPHPYKKEVIKLYIVLKDNYVLNSEIKKSIKEYCEENLPAYALPYAYGYRKELPKTLSGKVAYQELINTKEEL